MFDTNIENNVTINSNVHNQQTDNRSSKYIYDPLEKISVGGNTKLSVLDIYLLYYELYAELVDDKLTFILAPEIKTFFAKQGKCNPNKDFELKRNKLIHKWESYNNSRKQRTIGATNGNLRNNNVEYNLLIATKNNEINWEEIINSHSQTVVTQEYVCCYNDLRWIFHIDSFKNKEGKWKKHFELKWYNEYSDFSLYGGEYYFEIYNAIQKNLVHHHKKNREILDKSIIIVPKQEYEINSGSFLVKTNLFRCFHKKHILEEIIGVVKIITPQGKEEICKVPCAYCSVCNCFFMLSSTFRELCEKGIVLCQLIDKDEYYKTGKLCEFNQSSESVLMRNGYNVKANEGLTDIQRQIILKNIIDNKMLPPHRIVSYIDMFIAQKEKMIQYQNAIEKWKKDRQFVLSYRESEKRSVEIEKIEV